MLVSSASAVPLPSSPPSIPRRDDQSRRTVRTLVESVTASPSTSGHPVESLRRGDWVKLICGASFEDSADVRNLSLVYALSGVDCIDCAADSSVVTAAAEGIEAAVEVSDGLARKPWLMISVNDDETDLHFRKAEFDPEECPKDCSRPCERVCPANAIALEKGGVITERCYGCGRCFPVCPYDKIRASAYVRDATATSQLLRRPNVDAIEIHTSGRRTDLFQKLWHNLGDSIGHVKIVAVSLPNLCDLTLSAMNEIYSIMDPHFQWDNLWQLDGRPMSGDIGRGATREAIAFATEMAAVQNRPHGFLQLAGGTNAHTIDCLKKAGLFKTMKNPDPSGDIYSGNSPHSLQALIGGIAYGGYARKIVGRVLSEMQSEHGIAHIEDHPEYLLKALKEAITLVRPVKCYDLPSYLL